MWSEEYCHFIWIVVSVFQAKVTLEPNTNCREWDEVFQLADSEYGLEGLPASIIMNPKTYEVCSKSIRIGIVVVVHWVGCVCNQS
jgi:hypothetical protein